ncbi:MAG TPA: PEP-CTERM sorting domain-containing protein [Verrucomicrobiota bacterium]|nr:PEP-CTERM sorting domain-containing protein [Verrucomicrobiota bacterium]HNU51961.1 PEP-CTERM sorting domain-containing protein [Verrucomicrobiota bacterium]
MQTGTRLVAALILGTSIAVSLNAASIVNIVETGGKNEATDTIPAKWSGQTWTVTVADEPVPGLIVGDSYTLGTFASGTPIFVDRNHRVLDDPSVAYSLPVPSYLVGGEYIMSGNDNRDMASYRLDVTVSAPVTVYMLIDNRLSDGDNATPPTFDATHMQWIVDQGWAATDNGLNRFSNSAVPDEVAVDEGSNGDIQQWYSVYSKDFDAGTFTLLQADNAGRNMYGAVVVTIPEPSVLALLALGGLGLAAALRRRS